MIHIDEVICDLDTICAFGNSVVDYLNGRGHLDVKPYSLFCIKTELEETFPEASFAFDFRKRKFRIICFTPTFKLWIDIRNGVAKLLTYQKE